MKPRARARRRGYLLVSVALMLVVVAAVVLLLINSGASGNAAARAIATGDRMRLVANAGLERARWASRAAGCAASLGLGSSAFDGVNLSATQTGGGATTTTYALAPSADAWIGESGAAQNHGSDAELLLRDGAGQREIGLLRFDLASLPTGAHVVEATLSLNATSGDPAGAIELREVASSWIEGAVSWAQINAAIGSGALGVLPPPVVSGAELRVNLSELAQAWANVPASNFGVALVARSTSGQRTRVATREAASLLRPRLRVVVVSGAITPAVVQSVGTLALGVQRTLTASGVTLEQAGAELILQTPGATEDAYLDANSSSSNFGGATTLHVSGVGGDQAALLRFGLHGLPSGATILDARLGLYLQSASSLTGGVISAHRAIRGWTEAGATHAKYDGSMPWTTPGGDYEPRAAAERTFAAATPGFYEWDVTSLARDWHAGGGGGGVLLRGTTAVNAAVFTSSEAADATRHPYLRLTLSCACGAACNVPRRTGSLLLVVGDTSALTPGDAAARAALAAWGYSANLLADEASASAFASGAAANDAIYVAASADPAALSGKLGSLAKGIVSEEPGIAAELGLATGFGSSSATSVTLSDTAHEITRAFASLQLAIHEQPRLLTTLSGTLASGLSPLASVSGAPSLAALEKGAARTGGGGAAGRRVMLPIGASSTANWTRLAAGGKTVVRRAVEWAMKTPPPAEKLPIAHWKLDETSGLIATDSVGGHHAALTGAVSWTPSGQIDGALRFAGTAGTATAPHHSALNPTAALTISTWAYLDRSSSTGTFEIVSKRGLPGNTGYGIWWYNGDIRFAGGSAITSAGVSLAPRVWQHLAVTFDDAANQVAFFVDGVERRRSSFSGSIPATTASFHIGAQPYYSSYWNGVLDDVRLYDTALSAEEIAALSKPGGGGSPATPPSDACQATFADDFQTNGYGGSSGTLAWESAWSEINDDGSPSGDDEIVTSVGSTLAVRIRDNDGSGEGIERTFRPPAGVSSAKLSFGSWRSGLDDADDFVAIQLSADGKPWVEVARIAGPTNDSTSGPAKATEVDVTSQLGAVTRVRFIGSPDLGGGDIVYFDDVTMRLAVSCP